VIRIKAAGFPQFFAAHAILRAAGVRTIPAGGNEMRVPDDTDRGVLRTVAETGAAVHADLNEPVADGGTPSDATPAKTPRKTTPRRRTKE
jgi:hypothetical protein